MSAPDDIRVLHVDDDEGFADLTARFLERADRRLDVVTATDATAGLEALGDGDVDCVVSDHDMPGRSGIEFLEDVREAHPHLPFVLFTGKGSEEVASEAISAGVSDYLQKTGSDDQYAVLANRIVTLVEKHEAERAREHNRLLVEESTDAILVVAPDATIRYASPAAERVLGRTPEQLVGTSGFAPIHPEDRERVQAAFAELVDRPDARRSVEFRYERPDGTWIWAEARGRNLLESDVVDGIVVYTRDVTGRTEREAAIEGLHDTVRGLIEAETPERAAEVAVESVRDVLGMPANAVHLYDEDEAGLVPVASTEYSRELVGDVPTFHGGDSLAWEVFETGDPGVYDDVSSVPGRYAPETSVRSELILPLGDHGVLLVGSDEPDRFDETDVSLAKVLAAHVATVLGRIERERDLRQTERQYRALVENFPDGGVFLYDEDLECVLAGGTELATVGLSADDVTGTALRERYPEAVADELEGHLRAALEGEDREFEQTYRSQHYRVQVRPIRDAAGEVRNVLAVSQNVTDRKESERLLEVERDRLTALFEMVPDPIAHVRFEDGTPTLLDANRAFEETFGCDVASVAGRSVNDIVVPPGHETEAEALDYRARAEGGVDEEVRRQTASGVRDFLLRSVPVGDPEETDEYIGVYVDVSELKDTERRLTRQNERLEEFASVVSHDLRNPLNVAEGRLELARETGDEEQFDAVERAHERMRALIEDLLQLARESDRPAEMEPVALRRTVETCWQNVDTGTDGSLVVDTDRTLRGEASRVKQLLENLLRNAVEHGSTSSRPEADDAVEHGSTSPRSHAHGDAVEHGSTSSQEADDGDGESVTVTVGGLEDGFYVADDGPGIPEAERERVFESGYSTAEAGTGFGLAIVREIADAHGWDVRVTESERGGARFEVTGVEFEGQ